ncbi:MAG: putative hydroxymethylpyrimidine transporter CytX [Oscillospiraceae bacterium]
MKQEESKASSSSQMLLWFGAAISIAEIITGALLAPLGLKTGLLAIVVGHIIGAAILLPAGLIGAKTGLSAAQSVSVSFGKYGSYGFSVLNILQLLGWTAIMIINGAKAFNAITMELWNFQNQSLWSIAIGLLICLWVILGIKNLAKVNPFIMLALFVFTIILGVTVFQNGGANAPVEGSITFGSAVELNVAMSLSWLPLIADYTRNLKKKRSGTVCSVLGYFVGSLIMFVIGLGAAIYAGTSDITVILLSAGLGLAALVIVLFSTVTTTYLDVYSAGVCAANLHKKPGEKISALIVCAVGTILALFVSMSQYESFLYLIGSVFAPLFAILFTDYFLCGKQETSSRFNIKNTVLWVVGFVAYQFLMPYNSVLGITLPVMVGMGLISFFVGKIEEKFKFTEKAFPSQKS